MNKEKHIDVSIIIVHYGKFKILGNCLDSIYDSKPECFFEIIVVDNDEKEKIDKKLQKTYKHVKYIRAAGNIGYGAGNNLGVNQAKGKYILILNPDTRVSKGMIDRLVAYLNQHRKVSVVAPTFIKGNGQVYEYQGSRFLTPISAIFSLSIINKLFPNNPISSKYYLKDLNFHKSREVDSVPGSCFMIRKEVFISVNGFDEKYFLYFEEADLFKRIKDQGGKIVMISNAKVVHYHRKSTPSSLNTKIVFRKSRFKYFFKHFGFVKAIIVEIILRTDFSLFIILVLATVLRFYKLTYLFGFSGELGDNLLDVKNALISRTIPLIGPPTSHPWLNFGPIYYWILSPFVLLFRYNPIAISVLGAISGVIAVYLNYIFITKLFNKTIAIFSSYLIGISAFFVQFSRTGRFMYWVNLLFYPLIYFVATAKKHEIKKYFAIGLIVGVMLNFHLTALVLIPSVLIFLMIRKLLTRKNLLWFFVGSIVPMLPFLIYDTRNNFEMTINFIVWIPYRLSGFLGIVPKNNLTVHSLVATVQSIINYLSVNFYFGNNIITFVIAFFVFISIIIFAKRGNKVNNLLIYTFVISIVAFAIHSNPPIHYFVPIFTFPAITLGYMLSKIWVRKKYKYIVVVFVMLISYLNMNFLFSKKYFFADPTTLDQKTGVVYFKLQKKIVDYIVEDANGRNISLRRIGPNDEFQGNFAQNYEYLMWLNGNEPVRVGDEVIKPQLKPEIQYTIFERTVNQPDQHNSIFWIDKVAILKEELK
jgi:hypothetical protein